MQFCRQAPPWLMILPIVLSTFSCSQNEPLHPVQGKVLYKGAPLKGATVTFFPREAREEGAEWPIGTTSDDGTFSLHTSGAAGAAAGQYNVAIVCLEMVPGSLKGMSMEGTEEKDKLRSVYADPASSNLSAEIKAGPNQLEPFELK